MNLTQEKSCATMRAVVLHTAIMMIFAAASLIPVAGLENATAVYRIIAFAAISVIRDARVKSLVITGLAHCNDLLEK